MKLMLLCLASSNRTGGSKREEEPQLAWVRKWRGTEGKEEHEPHSFLILTQDSSALSAVTIRQYPEANWWGETAIPLPGNSSPVWSGALRSIGLEVLRAPDLLQGPLPAHQPLGSQARSQQEVHRQLKNNCVVSHQQWKTSNKWVTTRASCTLI